MGLPKDDDVIQAFSTDRANQPLGMPYGQNTEPTDGLAPPLDGNSAGDRPIARGTSLAPRAADRLPEETAGRCPMT
jgi:hypothetical protein